MMTPIERWTKVLKRQKTDRIPMDYWATEEFTQKLMKYTGISDFLELMKYLKVDFVFNVEPVYTGPTPGEDEDIFGCKYKKVDYGTGLYNECVYNPLAKYKSVEEIKKNYNWPSPDWWDYSTIKKQIEGKEDYPIKAMGSEPFLKYKDLRGQEQAFIDLIENPEIVHYCLDKLFDLAYKNTSRIFEQIPGKITFIYVAEDMGSQEGLMFSPSQIKEFLLPGMKRMIDLAHQAGVYVFHHNDGAIREIIPSLIDIGIDILNPIQWRCKGMDRENLKKDFGDKLIFHGGVDNQFTLPFGTKKDVEEEVKTNIEILGKNGGYILAPCHNIQPITPPENVITMYQTASSFSSSF